jgi:hypothetical protein
MKVRGDFGGRVGMQVEPAGGHSIAARTRGDDGIVIAEVEIADGVERRLPDLRPTVVRTRSGMPPVKTNERRIRPPVQPIRWACALVSPGLDRRSQSSR